MKRAEILNAPAAPVRIRAVAPRDVNINMRRAGFTLVELLLYLGFAAVMLLVIAVFFRTMLEARVQNQVIAEVEQQGAAVLVRVTQTVRNATGISSPTPGASAAALTVTVPTAALSPTVLDLSGGAIRITEGAGSAVALTNSRVIASALTFQSLSRTGTPGTVRATFTLSHVNSTGRNEYEYSKIFYGSASLR